MYTASDSKNRYMFLIILLLFAYLIISNLEAFFASFLGALMFYILSKPFFNWLVKKKHWRKSTTATLIIIISFVLIMLPLALIVKLMYSRIAMVLADPNIVADSLKNLDAIIQQKYDFNLISDKTIASIKASATGLLPVFLNKSLAAVSTMIMMCFFMYFMIINGSRMEAGAMLYLPFKRADIKMLGNELSHQTFSNSIVIPLICVAEGVASFIAYIIIGLPQAGFWAVITGITSLVPIIGTAIIWVPAAGYMLITNHIWQCIFMVGYGLVALSTIDNIVRFMLAKKVAHVHPVVTVLGVIVGVKFFGFLGIIFGPLLISYLIIGMKIYYVQYRKPFAAKRNYITNRLHKN